MSMTDRQISEAARELYEALKHAGFDRSTFTALGQAVAAGHGWERLAPTVKGPLMRIVLRLVPDSADGTGPAAPDGPEATTPAPEPPAPPAKPAASANGTKPERA